MSAARLRGLFIAASMLAPPLLQAQRSEGGRVEIGALTSFATFNGEHHPFAGDFGVGVRAGWFINRVLSVEAIAGRTLTRHSSLGSVVDIAETGGSVLATMPAIGRNRIFVGAGLSSLGYRGWAGFRDQTMHVLVGDRIPLSRMAALRLEARAIMTSATNAPGAPDGSAMSLRISAGVSFFARELTARDRDGDLVPDRVDRCAETPRGLLVVATGCPRDSDGDAVFDGVDACQATPSGVPVDRSGCAPDTDADGVADHLDRCARTEGGVEVGPSGCPPDSDADGVINLRDRCGATPAGVAVDAEGCPRDTDRDGVADHLDRCPESAVGQRVDEIGCQVLFVEEKGVRQPLVLRGVNFELGSAVLTDESFAVLDQVAASLAAYPEVTVEVAGHTDMQGSEEFNRALSLSRAEAVREFLVTNGVKAEQLVARGYGALQPVGSNETEEGRARNRRVELRPIERGEP